MYRGKSAWDGMQAIEGVYVYQIIVRWKDGKEQVLAGDVLLNPLVFIMGGSVNVIK